MSSLTHLPEEMTIEERTNARRAIASKQCNQCKEPISLCSCDISPELWAFRRMMWPEEWLPDEVV